MKDLKDKLFQILILISFFGVTILIINLNIPNIILKFVLLSLFIFVITASLLEKQRILDKLSHKYEDINILIDNIYNHFPDIVICKDKNLNITFANKAFFKEFNCKKDIKGRKINYFLDDETAYIINQQDKYVIENNKINKFYVNNKSSNSNYYCISLPLVKNGETKGIATLVRDVSKEKFLDTQLENTHGQIKSLINNLPIISYITDINGDYILGNQKSYKFYTEGIDSDNNLRIDLNSLHKELAEGNEHIINTQEILIFNKAIKALDGSYHWYTWRKAPWILKNGEVKGFIIFINNVDMTKNLQAQRDNYIATLSHDLKTPTIAQIRSLELMLNGHTGEFSSEQQELLRLMLDSSNYMYSMLNTLVTTYKYENGEIILNYENFNILHIIEESMHNLARQIITAGLTIKIQSEIENPIVHADKLQVKRAIENLLSNAINFSFNNTEIIISVKEIAEHNIPKLCIKFIYQSPYMNKESLSNIFKKYVTHKDKFNRVGAGLGLYLSKQIIEAHKGNIFITSTKENINTFGFILNR